MGPFSHTLLHGTRLYLQHEQGDEPVWSTGLPLSLVKKIPSVSSPLIGDKIPKSEIYKARPYTRAVRGPQSKGMGQWQLTSLAKGEFASKKMFRHALGQFYGPF
jgi:hypothetical protein